MAKREGRDIAEYLTFYAQVEGEDGLAFDLESIVGSQIRDESDYVGVRVKVTARLVTARIALHIDVNFGDPIWPEPTDTDVPRMLGGAVRIKGYPDHMVLAEKIDAVAAYRGATLHLLSEVLTGMADIAQGRWVTWRRKQRLEGSTPERFQDLLEVVVAFADPILDGWAGDATWVPGEGRWAPEERLAVVGVQAESVRT